MAPTDDLSSSSTTWGDVRDALQSNDKDRVAAASDLCVRLGSQVAHHLVVELERKKNRPAFRVRVAKILERIGHISQRDWFDLMIIMRIEKSREVRDAANQLFKVLRANIQDDGETFHQAAGFYDLLETVRSFSHTGCGGQDDPAWRPTGAASEAVDHPEEFRDLEKALRQR